jgi:hypothetical protein
MSPGNRPSICTADQLNCIALTSRLHLDVGGYNYRPTKSVRRRQTYSSARNASRFMVNAFLTRSSVCYERMHTCRLEPMTIPF